MSEGLVLMVGMVVGMISMGLPISEQTVDKGGHRGK